MLILVRGSNKIMLKNIKDVTVTSGGGRYEVLIKHTTEKTESERVDVLTNPRQPYSNEQAVMLADDIDKVVATPDMPLIDQIKTYLWGTGNAALNLDFEKKISVFGLAHLCWFWRFGQKPSAKQIQIRTTFSENQAKTVASYAEYTAYVRDLILDGYPTAEEFVKWKANYSSMEKRFGERMRMPEDIVAGLIKSISTEYGIKEDKSKEVNKGMPYTVTWGCYHEPDGRKHDLYGEETIQAATLTSAKQMATSKFTDWLRSPLSENDADQLEFQKTMASAYDVNKGKWLDGSDNAAKTIGEKDGTWSGLFLKVKKQK